LVYEIPKYFDPEGNVVTISTPGVLEDFVYFDGISKFYFSPENGSIDLLGTIDIQISDAVNTVTTSF
jgi:hypothetical protein